MQDPQKQLKDMSVLDTVLTAMPDLEISAINGLKNTLDFLMNSQNITGKMFVSKDKTWYYDDSSTLHTYGNLQNALTANPSFDGIINVTEDMTWNDSNVGTSLYLDSGKNITVDLNGNTLSVGNTFALATVVNNTNVTFRNGTICEDADGYGALQTFCLANGGKVNCEHLTIDIRDVIEREPAGNYYIKIFNISERDPYTVSAIDYNGVAWNYSSIKDNVKQAQQLSSGIYAIENLSCHSDVSAGPCSIYIDRFCDISITESSHSYNMLFWIFEPSYLLKIYGYQADVAAGVYIRPTADLKSKYMTHANGRIYLSAIQPYIYCDGNCEIKVDLESPTIKDDADLQNAQYGTYMNGTYRAGVDFNLGPNGKITVEHGHGLYSVGQNTTITLHGGTIVGSNGITMRGGTFIVPANANPTVIGNADYFRYNPVHTGGQAGAGLFVGHAVMLESCTDTDASYGLVSADIESGQYISKNNTSIGSVQMAKSFPDFYKQFECFSRARGFVKGGTLNKTPNESGYSLDWTYDKPERTLSAFYGDSVSSVLSIYVRNPNTQTLATQIASGAGDTWLNSSISDAVENDPNGYLKCVGYWHTLLSGRIDETLSTAISSLRHAPDAFSMSKLSTTMTSLSNYWKTQLNSMTVGEMVGHALSAGLLPLAYINNRDYPYYDFYAKETDSDIVADGFTTSVPTTIIKKDVV